MLYCTHVISGLLSPVSSPGKFSQSPRVLSLAGPPSRQRRLHPSRIVRTAHPFLRETSLLVERSWHCMKANVSVNYMLYSGKPYG